MYPVYVITKNDLHVVRCAWGHKMMAEWVYFCNKRKECIFKNFCVQKMIHNSFENT